MNDRISNLPNRPRLGASYISNAQVVSAGLPAETPIDLRCSVLSIHKRPDHRAFMDGLALRRSPALLSVSGYGLEPVADEATVVVTSQASDPDSRRRVCDSGCHGGFSFRSGRAAPTHRQPGSSECGAKKGRRALLSGGVPARR